MLVIVIATLTIGLFMAPIVGFPLFAGTGIVCALALRQAWKKDLRNPPWYILKVKPWEVQDA
jgi:4-hydroxybenzoate polyprenyltransferase